MRGFPFGRGRIHQGEVSASPSSASTAARATSKEKPARASAARSRSRLAARISGSPRKGPSRRRRTKVAAAERSASGALVQCEHLVPDLVGHALVGQAGRDQAPRRAPRPQPACQRCPVGPIVEQTELDQARHRRLDPLGVLGGIAAQLLEALLGPPPEHAPQIRDRARVALDMVERDAQGALTGERPRLAAPPAAGCWPGLRSRHPDRRVRPGSSRGFGWVGASRGVAQECGAPGRS